MALTACNLKERLSLLQEAGPDIEDALQSCSLSPADLKIIRSAVERLAPHYPPQVEHGERDAARLGDRLALFRRLELQFLDGVAPPRIPGLEAMHGDWLPTLCEAMENFSAGPRLPEEIRIGRSGIAVAPFLQWIADRLEPETQARDLPISPRVVSALQLHFLNRVEPMVIRAVETELRASEHEGSHHDDFPTFMERLFADRERYLRFLESFPVAARLLAGTARRCVESCGEAVTRLRADRRAVAERFNGGVAVTRILTLRFGLSDPHAGGRTVAEALLASEAGEVALIYKPRPVDGEEGFWRLAQDVSQRADFCLPAVEVLAGDEYGYCRQIKPTPDRILSRSSVEEFYRTMGRLLACVWVIGGSDMHWENVLAQDGTPFIVDCETLCPVEIEDPVESTGGVADSVFRTGMLEWPRSDTADRLRTPRLGALEGGLPYLTDLGSPVIEDPSSASMRVVQRSGIEVGTDRRNRVSLAEGVADPRDFVDAVKQGLDQFLSWIADPRNDFSSLLKNSFQGRRFRRVVRPTQIYASIINATRHPLCLLDPLEVDSVFAALVEQTKEWDRRRILAAEEVAALWNLDVPIFRSDAAGRALLSGTGLEVTELRRPPASSAVAAVAACVPHRNEQSCLVGAALSKDGFFTEDFERLARRIVDEVAELVVASVVEQQELSPSRNPLGETLYSGHLGFGYFLAYLGEIRSDPELLKLALKCLELAKRDSLLNKFELSVFEGKAGLIYLSLHLGCLLERQDLLDEAARLSTDLSRKIAGDRKLDVMHGVAGLIPLAAACGRATDNRSAHDTIRRAADHLLQQAVPQGDTLSWPSYPRSTATAPLTGFSHGASGIGWALCLAALETGHEPYAEVGAAAFRYETSQWHGEDFGWLDHRSSSWEWRTGLPTANYWCNGAPGIGLARLSLLEAGMQFPSLEEDARKALLSVLRHLDQIVDGSLCHGWSSIVEFFWRYGSVLNEPAGYLEALSASTQLWTLLSRNEKGQLRSAPGTLGLMNGLAGIGLQHLRLIAPERVPSPLLLEPPRRLRRSEGPL